MFLGEETFSQHGWTMTLPVSPKKAFIPALSLAHLGYSVEKSVPSQSKDVGEKKVKSGYKVHFEAASLQA